MRLANLALRAYTSEELVEELKARPVEERDVPGMTIEDALDLLEEAGVPEELLAAVDEWWAIPVADQRRMDAWIGFCNPSV